MRPADTGRLVHHLVGFRSVYLDAGERSRVRVECSVRPLQRWTDDGFGLDPGDVAIRVASYAGDPDAVEARLTIAERKLF